MFKKMLTGFGRKPSRSTTETLLELVDIVQHLTEQSIALKKRVNRLERRRAPKFPGSPYDLSRHHRARAK